MLISIRKHTNIQKQEGKNYDRKTKISYHGVLFENGIYLTHEAMLVGTQQIPLSSR